MSDPRSPSVPAPADQVLLSRNDDVTSAIEEIRKECEATRRSSDYPYSRVCMFDLETVLDEINRLKGEALLLAKLASDKPQFDNPLIAWKAQEIRDRILGEADAR